MSYFPEDPRRFDLIGHFLVLVWIVTHWVFGTL